METFAPGSPGTTCIGINLALGLVPFWCDASGSVHTFCMMFLSKLGFLFGELLSSSVVSSWPGDMKRPVLSWSDMRPCPRAAAQCIFYGCVPAPQATACLPCQLASHLV